MHPPPPMELPCTLAFQTLLSQDPSISKTVMKQSLQVDLVKIQSQARQLPPQIRNAYLQPNVCPRAPPIPNPKAEPTGMAEVKSTDAKVMFVPIQ